MTTLIRQALIPTDTDLSLVDLMIQGDQIAAIEPCDPHSGRSLLSREDANGLPPDHQIDARDQLLIPGLVNGHTHSPQIWVRGVVQPLPLELWLSEMYSVAPSDPERIYWSAVATAVETLLSGGTTVMDHLSLIPGHELTMIEAVVRAYRDVGIRTFIAPLIRDESMQAGIPSRGERTRFTSDTRSTEGLLELMQEVIDRFHQPAEGIHIAVGPTGPQLCSDRLFQGCIELSDRYDLCRHSHLLETRAQQQLCLEKFGCTGVEHLQRLGYLGSRTSLAHGIWLTDSDIQILAESGSTVVHNPLSNLRLGSGIAPVLKYRQARVNVSFGCDGAASSDGQDLWEAIKLGTILHCVTEGDYRQWITPRQGLEMAALGGAKGVNLGDQLGSLQVGKSADLVLIDLKKLSLLPRTDPVGLLILGRPERVVDQVWVRGRQIVREGQLMSISADTLKQQLFRGSHWQVKRMSPATHELEQRYRTVMDLECS